jgi:hypothetical protein
MRSFLRSIYWWLRSLPVVGPLVEGLRNRLRGTPKLDVQATLWELKEQGQAHGLAISGLRDALARALDAVDRMPDEFEHQRNSLRQGLSDGLAAIEQQIYKIADNQNHRFDELSHYQNQKIDEHRDLILNRVEFNRTEAMLEIRRLLRADLGGPAAKAPVEIRVVDESKVAAQRAAGAIRLNLGCGHIPEKGYINIDMRALPGVDVVAPVDQLPFENGEIDEIYGAHLAEHFPEHVFLNQILPYWKEKLRPGGTLRLVLPNAEAMVRAYVAGETDFATLALIVMGGQEYEGDFHFAFYNPERLTAVLEKAGFRAIELVTPARRNGLCLEMELRAQRP